MYILARIIPLKKEGKERKRERERDSLF